MTSEGTSEAKKLTCGPVERAQRVQQNGVAQPSEQLASPTPSSASRELNRVSNLAMRIRENRTEQHLGHGTPIRDMIDEGRC